MNDDARDGDFIAAFLRDALCVDASAWIVRNVAQIWLRHGVAPAALTAAVDAVAAEGIDVWGRLDIYRAVISDAVAGRDVLDLIPTQRAGEPESHAVAIHCSACDERLPMHGNEASLSISLAGFTARHSSCPPFAIEAQTFL